MERRVGTTDLGIAALQDIRNDPGIEVVPVDTELFARGVALHASRPDREWCVTGCVSLTVMEERGLTGVLTTDRYSEQGGFRSLLRKS